MIITAGVLVHVVGDGGGEGGASLRNIIDNELSGCFGSSKANGHAA